MERDLRETALYQEVEAFYRQAFEPGFGHISGAADLAPTPDGAGIAFTGSRRDRLEGMGASRICLADVRTGALDTLTNGPNDDRLPKWAPDGSQLAFLSDRTRKRHFQLYLLPAGRVGEAIAAPEVPGTIEYFAWSPDGRRILLGVAGTGVDLAGVQGSGAAEGGDDNLPEWMPSVDTGADEAQWRRLWIYDPASQSVRQLSRDGLNVWEAGWAGPDRVVAVVSTAPGEDAWYTAPLALIDATSGEERVLYRSRRQLGLPAASPSGRCIAVVQSLCSDRAVIAGDVLLLEAEGGEPQEVDSAGVDVTWIEWQDDDHLFYGGLRGPRVVFGMHTVSTGAASERWSLEGTTGPFYPQAAMLADGALAVVQQRFDCYPKIAIVRDGDAQTVVSLGHAGSEFVLQRAGVMQHVAWTAPDGLEIQGYLVTPPGSGLYPLIVYVHGGPVAAHLNRWAMGGPNIALLASRGYALLFPNPRGSSGRGQAFMEMVRGDMGGADAQDILAGIDAMVERGVADPARIGVTGGSYGGFMSNWIITQDDRFAAAVPMAPIGDWLSQHYTSNIPTFDRDFLGSAPVDPGGQYFTRSPILFADRVRTPTLQLCGARDKCTPPTQALEFHRALLEHGVEAALVTYPQEGHGVRALPAAIDAATRTVAWFERFMGPSREL